MKDFLADYWGLILALSIALGFFGWGVYEAQHPERPDPARQCARWCGVGHTAEVEAFRLDRHTFTCQCTE